MTIIAAVTDGRRTVMGADSAGSDGDEIYCPANSKIFRQGPYVIGYTMSYRMGQILRYGVDWPEPPTGDDDLESFMVTEIVETVRRAFAAGGVRRVENGVESGAQFLVALRGAVFSVGRYFEVAWLPEPYIAIGSGRRVAYGAFHALVRRTGLTLEERVRRALEAAAAYTSSVRGPFSFLATAEGLGDDARTC